MRPRTSPAKNAEMRKRRQSWIANTGDNGNPAFLLNVDFLRIKQKCKLKYKQSKYFVWERLLCPDSGTAWNLWIVPYIRCLFWSQVRHSCRNWRFSVCIPLYFFFVFPCISALYSLVFLLCIPLYFFFVFPCISSLYSLVFLLDSPIVGSTHIYKYIPKYI